MGRINGQKSARVGRLPRSGTGFPPPQVCRPRCETAHFGRTLVLGSPDRPTLVLLGPWAGPTQSREPIPCPLGIDCLSKSGDVRPNSSSTHATPSVGAVDSASPTQPHRLEYWEMSPLLRTWDPLTGTSGASPRPKKHQGGPVWRAKYQSATEMRCLAPWPAYLRGWKTGT